MEASALEDFLNWADAVGILNKITVVCCDQDSSTHKLITSDPRCKHMEVLFDPGHMKKSFQKTLIGIFGKSKHLKNFASRVAAWMMRSLSEAKALHKNNRVLIQAEFIRRMSCCVPHYTLAHCPPSCPCHSTRIAIIPQKYKLATETSFIPQASFINIFSHLDSKELGNISPVCRYWNLLIENYLKDLDKKENKTTITATKSKFKKMSEFTTAVNQVSFLLFHSSYSCYYYLLIFTFLSI
jgi:hypothetical protein